MHQSARDDLASRIQHALKVTELADDAATSRHLKRLMGMDTAALDAQWYANSTQLRRPQPKGFRLDLRPRYLARGLRSYRSFVWEKTGRPLAPANDLRPRHRQTLDPHRRRVHAAAQA